MTDDVTRWLDETTRRVRRDAAARAAVLERRYRCSVDELWSACTDRARLARWFADVRGPLQVGGALEIHAGLAHPITSRVVACEPPAGAREGRIVITWSYDGDPLPPDARDEVEARIARDGDGARLVLEHRATVGYPFARGVGSGWESWLWGLDRALASLEGAPVRGAPDDVAARIDARWTRHPEPTATLRDVPGHAGRRALTLVRRIRAPRADVWRAVTSSFSQWYPARLEGELRAGAVVSFVFEDGAALRGRITACEAPSLLALTEEGDEARVELVEQATPTGPVTLLTFTHVFDAPGAPPSFATGWERCLDALEALATNAPLPAAFDDDERAAWREAYARVFP